MDSDEEQDVPERNILYLRELKAVLLAKNQLLKQNNLTTEPKNHSDIDIVNEKHKLLTSLLHKSNLDNAFIHISLDLFTREHIVNNKSENKQFLEFKEKIYKLLQELKKLTNYTQTLITKLQTLTIKYEKIQEEISVLKRKHQRISEKTMKTLNRQRGNEVGEGHIEQKKQLELPVKKINLMAAIMKGLIHHARGISWKKNPDLDEIAGMCRHVYKRK